MNGSVNPKESATMDVRVIMPVQETESASNTGHNPAKAPAKLDEARTSRSESFCKLLAVFIVLVSFVFHLLRGAQEGMFFTHD